MRLISSSLSRTPQWHLSTTACISILLLVLSTVSQGAPPGIPIASVSRAGYKNSDGLDVLTVSWAKPAENGLPILSYEVQVKEKDLLSPYWNDGPTPEFGDIPLSPLFGSALAVNYTQTAKWTQYTFRVRATNAESPSAWSSPTIELSPQAPLPPTAVNLRVQHHPTQVCLVSLTTPPFFEGDRYMQFRMHMSDPAGFFVFTTYGITLSLYSLHTSSPNTNFGDGTPVEVVFQIYNCPSSEIWDFKIGAHSESYGTGELSSFVFDSYITPTSAPDAPTDIELEVLNSTALRVSWTEEQFTAPATPLYEIAAATTREVWTLLPTTTSQTSMVINYLDLTQPMSFRMRVFDRASYSPWSRATEMNVPGVPSTTGLFLEATFVKSPVFQATVTWPLLASNVPLDVEIKFSTDSGATWTPSGVTLSQLDMNCTVVLNPANVALPHTFGLFLATQHGAAEPVVVESHADIPDPLQNVMVYTDGPEYTYTLTFTPFSLNGDTIERVEAESQRGDDGSTALYTSEDIDAAKGRATIITYDLLHNVQYTWRIRVKSSQLGFWSMWSDWSSNSITSKTGGSLQPVDVTNIAWGPNSEIYFQYSVPYSSAIYPEFSENSQYQCPNSYWSSRRQAQWRSNETEVWSSLSEISGRHSSIGSFSQSLLDPDVPFFLRVRCGKKPSGSGPYYYGEWSAPSEPIYPTPAAPNSMLNWMFVNNERTSMHARLGFQNAFRSVVPADSVDVRHRPTGATSWTYHSQTITSTGDIDMVVSGYDLTRDLEVCARTKYSVTGAASAWYCAPIIRLPLMPFADTFSAAQIDGSNVLLQWTKNSDPALAATETGLSVYRAYTVGSYTALSYISNEAGLTAKQVPKRTPAGTVTYYTIGCSTHVITSCVLLAPQKVITDSAPAPYKLSFFQVNTTAVNVTFVTPNLGYGSLPYAWEADTSISSAGPWTLAGTTALQHIALPYSGPFYVRVRAINAEGAGPPSHATWVNLADGDFVPPFPPPRNLNHRAGGDEFTVLMNFDLDEMWTYDPIQSFEFRYCTYISFVVDMDACWENGHSQLVPYTEPSDTASPIVLRDYFAGMTDLPKYKHRIRVRAVTSRGLFGEWSTGTSAFQHGWPAMSCKLAPSTNGFSVSVDIRQDPMIDRLNLRSYITHYDAQRRHKVDAQTGESIWFSQPNLSCGSVCNGPHNFGSLSAYRHKFRIWTDLSSSFLGSRAVDTCETEWTHADSPPAPAYFSASISYSGSPQVTVSWQTASSSSFYNTSYSEYILEESVDQGPWTPLTTEDYRLGSFSYVRSGIVFSGVYKYRISLVHNDPFLLQSPWVETAPIIAGQLNAPLNFDLRPFASHSDQLLAVWDPHLTTGSDAIANYTLIIQDNSDALRDGVVLPTPDAGATSAIISGLEPEKRYSFSLRANGVITGPGKETPAAQRRPVTSVVTNVTATGCATGQPTIYVSYSVQAKGHRIIGVIVERDEGDSHGMQPISYVGPLTAATGVVDANVQLGKTYTYRVRVTTRFGDGSTDYDAGAFSEVSNPVTIGSDACPPSPPVNLEFTIDWDAYILHWDPPDFSDSPVTHYVVQRAVQPSSAKADWISIGNSLEPVYRAEIGTAFPSLTRFEFRVAAVNSAGQSSFSAVHTNPALPPYGFPARPSPRMYTYCSTAHYVNHVYAEWEPVIAFEPVTRYVTRSRRNSGSWTSLTTFTAASHSLRIPFLQSIYVNDDTLDYEVWAHNAVANVDAGPKTTLTFRNPLDAPPPPTNVEVSKCANLTCVHVTWTPSCTDYRSASYWRARIDVRILDASDKVITPWNSTRDQEHGADPEFTFVPTQAITADRFYQFQVVTYTTQPVYSPSYTITPSLPSVLISLATQMEAPVITHRTRGSSISGFNVVFRHVNASVTDEYLVQVSSSNAPRRYWMNVTTGGLTFANDVGTLAVHGLRSRVRYQIRMCAISNTYGRSPWTMPFGNFIPTTAPSPPIEFRVGRESDVTTSIQLSWTPATPSTSTVAVTYIVSYRESNTNSPWTVSNELQSPELLVVSLSSSPYEFRVAAITEHFGVSDWAYRGETRGRNCPPTPTDVQMRQLSGADPGSAILEWNSNIMTPLVVDNLVSVSVNGGEWTKIASVQGGNSFNLTGLVIGNRYSYRVRGSSTNFGYGEWSLPSKRREFGAPTPPRSVTAVPGPRFEELVVKWEAPAELRGNTVNGYRVWFEPDSTGTWHPLEQTYSPTTFEVAVDNLVGNQNYRFRVQALSSTDSDLSEPTATMSGGSPAEVEIIRVAGISNNSALVEWQSKYAYSSPVMSLTVRVRDTVTLAHEDTLVPADNAFVVSHVHFPTESVVSGRAYEFSIRPQNSFASGLWSEPVSYTLGPQTSPPLPPTSVRISGSGSSTTELEIVWMASETYNLSNITGYEVEVSLFRPILVWSHGASVPASALSTSVNALIPNERYAFRVRAHSTLGPSSWSNTANDPILPGSPSDLEMTPDGYDGSGYRFYYDLAPLISFSGSAALNCRYQMRTIKSGPCSYDSSFGGEHYGCRPYIYVYSYPGCLMEIKVWAVNDIGAGGARIYLHQNRQPAPLNELRLISTGVLGTLEARGDVDSRPSAGDSVLARTYQFQYSLDNRATWNPIANDTWLTGTTTNFTTPDLAACYFIRSRSKGVSYGIGVWSESETCLFATAPRVPTGLSVDTRSTPQELVFTFNVDPDPTVTYQIQMRKSGASNWDDAKLFTSPTAPLIAQYTGLELYCTQSSYSSECNDLWTTNAQEFAVRLSAVSSGGVPGAWYQHPDRVSPLQPRALGHLGVHPGVKDVPGFPKPLVLVVVFEEIKEWDQFEVQTSSGSTSTFSACTITEMNLEYRQNGGSWQPTGVQPSVSTGSVQTQVSFGSLPQDSVVPGNVYQFRTNIGVASGGCRNMYIKSKWTESEPFVAGAPPAPTGISVGPAPGATESGMVQVSWSAPAFTINNDPVSEYDVEYRRIENEAAGPWVWAKTVVPTSAIITGLDEGIDLQFRAVSKSVAYGRGAGSYPSQVVRVGGPLSLRSVPPRVVDKVIFPGIPVTIEVTATLASNATEAGQTGINLLVEIPAGAIQSPPELDPLGGKNFSSVCVVDGTRWSCPSVSFEGHTDETFGTARTFEYRVRLLLSPTYIGSLDLLFTLGSAWLPNAPLTMNVQSPVTAVSLSVDDPVRAAGESSVYSLRLNNRQYAPLFVNRTLSFPVHGVLAGTDVLYDVAGDDASGFSPCSVNGPVVECFPITIFQGGSYAAGANTFIKLKIPLSFSLVNDAFNANFTIDTPGDLIVIGTPVTVKGGHIQNPEVAVHDNYPCGAGNVTISFGISNPLTASGIIQVYLPPGFSPNWNGTATAVHSSNSTLSGTATVTSELLPSSIWRVNISRDGNGAPLPSLFQVSNLILTSIRTSSQLGPSAPFKLATIESGIASEILDGPTPAPIPSIQGIPLPFVDLDFTYTTAGRMTNSTLKFQLSRDLDAQGAVLVDFIQGFVLTNTTLAHSQVISDSGAAIPVNVGLTKPSPTQLRLSITATSGVPQLPAGSNITLSFTHVRLPQGQNQVTPATVSTLCPADLVVQGPTPPRNDLQILAALLLEPEVVLGTYEAHKVTTVTVSFLSDTDVAVDSRIRVHFPDGFQFHAQGVITASSPTLDGGLTVAVDFTANNVIVSRDGAGSIQSGLVVVELTQIRNSAPAIHTSMHVEVLSNGYGVLSSAAIPDVTIFAPIKFSRTRLELSEGRSYPQRFDIVVDLPPNNNDELVLEIRSDTTQVLASPSIVTFNSTSTEAPVTVDVVAVDDDIREGDHVSAVTVVITRRPSLPIYRMIMGGVTLPGDGQIACEIDDNDILGVIQSFSPTFGPLIGGGTLTVVGRRLGYAKSEVTDIFIAGQKVDLSTMTWTEANNVTTIVCQIPIGPFAQYPNGMDGRLTVNLAANVDKFRPEAETVVSPTPFAYVPPAITSLAPHSGALSGGTNLTLTGDYLGRSVNDILDISVARIPCTSFWWHSSKQVGCITGPSSYIQRGPVVLTLANAGKGLSPVLYQYKVGSLEVVKVSPARAPADGGTLITIEGTGFGTNPFNIKDITLAGVSCGITSEWVSHTELRCTAPVTDTYPVTGQVIIVMRMHGDEPNYPSPSIAKFTWDPPSPKITDIRPLVISGDGGTRISIRGRYFGKAKSEFNGVYIDGIKCPTCTWSSTTQVVCTTPAKVNAATLNLPVEIDIDGRRNSGSEALGFGYGKECEPACGWTAVCLPTGGCRCDHGYAVPPMCEQRVITLQPVINSTSEDGAKADVLVKLHARPTLGVPVVVQCGTNVSTEAVVTGGSTLIFTVDNWQQSQPVSVVGVEDGLIDGPQRFEVNCTVLSGGDAFSQGPGIASVPLTNFDAAPKLFGVEPAIIPLRNVTITIRGANFDPRIKVFLGDTLELKFTIRDIKQKASQLRMLSTAVVSPRATFAAYDTGMTTFASFDIMQTTQATQLLLIYMDTAPEGYHQLKIITPEGGVLDLGDPLYFSDDCPQEGQFGRRQDCSTCPEGGECPGGYRVWPAPGYWNEGEESGFVGACSPAFRCMGGKNSTCAPRYTGKFCSECIDGFYEDKDLCLPCPSDESLIGYLIGDVIVWSTFALISIFVVDRLAFFQCVAIIRALQMLSAVGEMGTHKLPDWIRTLYEFLHLFSGDYSFLKPDCVEKVPFTSQFGVRIAYSVAIFLPLFLGLPLAYYIHRRFMTNKLGKLRESSESQYLAASAQAKLVGDEAPSQDLADYPSDVEDDEDAPPMIRVLGLKARRDKKSHFYFDRFIRCLFVWLTLMYFSYTSMALEAVGCYPLGGEYRLITKPTELCYTNTHSGLFATSIFVIVTYSVIFPCIFLYFVARNQEKLATDERFMEKYDYLVMLYKPQYMKFFMIELVILFTMAVGKTLLKPYPLAQCITASLVLAAKIGVVGYYRPFKDAIDDMVQGALAGALLIAVIFNYLNAVSITPGVPALSWTMMLVVIIVTMLCVLFLAIYLVIVIFVKNPMKAKMAKLEKEMYVELKDTGDDLDNYTASHSHFDEASHHDRHLRREDNTLGVLAMSPSTLAHVLDSPRSNYSSRHSIDGLSDAISVDMSPAFGPRSDDDRSVDMLPALNSDTDMPELVQAPHSSGRHVLYSTDDDTRSEASFTAKRGSNKPLLPPLDESGDNGRGDVSDSASMSMSFEFGGHGDDQTMSFSEDERRPPSPGKTDFSAFD